MAKIHKTRKPSVCSFRYPQPVWDKYCEKIDVLAYEDHPENLGEVVEECLCIIADKYWDDIKDHPEIREVTRAEADEFGQTWRPQALRVDDATLPEVLVATSKAPGQRSQREKDLLDADKPIGIMRSPKFGIEQKLKKGVARDEL